jgi:hypothetical protein
MLSSKRQTGKQPRRRLHDGRIDGVARDEPKLSSSWQQAGKGMLIL